MRKILFLAAISVTSVLVVATYIGLQVRPWLSDRYYGYLVSPDVAAHFNERYDANDPDALLDVFYPSRFEKVTSLPTIVWVHGGAFVRGSKDDIARYLEVLAAKHFTVVGVNYSLAPAKNYPRPVLQVNAALAFLSRNEATFHVDATKLFLAGDSAGAQIAAQLATAISSPPYAKRIGAAPSIERQQLRGVILYCGVYDYTRNDDDDVRAVAQRYLGNKASEPRLEELSVVRHITSDFPPMFVSVGNADRFMPQSRLLAETATKLGIPVDSVFFPDDYRPPLAHEYQFDLSLGASQMALNRVVQFIEKRLQ
jgi:acetyl esterase